MYILLSLEITGAPLRTWGSMIKLNEHRTQRNKISLFQMRGKYLPNWLINAMNLGRSEESLD